MQYHGIRSVPRIWGRRPDHYFTAGNNPCAGRSRNPRSPGRLGGPAKALVGVPGDLDVLGALGVLALEIWGPAFGFGCSPAVCPPGGPGLVILRITGGLGTLRILGVLGALGNLGGRGVMLMRTLAWSGSLRNLSGSFGFGRAWRRASPGTAGPYQGVLGDHWD